MRHFTLTFIVFGFLVFACNQTKSKKQLAIENIPADTIKNGPQEQEKFDRNKELEEDKIKSIKEVTALFKEKNIDEISNNIKFPLKREYPIPPIKNKEEFKQRFSEVFDEILINKIADAEIGQWSEVGWRGIMLDNGILWMANSDGIITSVNYQSEFEKKQRKALIDKEKKLTHFIEDIRKPDL